MFLVVGVSMIIDLVCCVAKIIECVCMRMLCACVVLVTSYLLYPFNIIFCFSLSTKSTSGSRHHTLSGISHSIG